MNKTMDKITINTGTYKPKTTEKTKELKEKKKKARKAFTNATKETKKQKLDEYIQTQRELRDELETLSKKRVEERIKKIIDEGGVKSDLFWKIRKRITNKTQAEDEYDTVTEEDELLTDPEKAKKHIADFYENLYQAREGTKEYEKWTNHITQTVQDIEREIESQPEEPEFTMDETNKVIQSLKSGKANGPDGVPNEMLKESNKETREIFRTEFNKILTSMEIPEQWTNGSLKRLYKGKGKKENVPMNEV